MLETVVLIFYSLKNKKYFKKEKEKIFFKYKYFVTIYTPVQKFGVYFSFFLF